MDSSEVKGVVCDVESTPVTSHSRLLLPTYLRLVGVGMGVAVSDLGGEATPLLGWVALKRPKP